MKKSCLLFVFLISACVSYPRTVSVISLAGDDFPLIKNNPGEYTCLQQITIKFNDKQYSFKAQVEVSQNKITIIGLTPVHSRSFLITFENGNINYEEQPFFKYPISPESIIADFQMVFTPIEQYQKGLSNYKVQVDQTPTIRRFFVEGKALAQVKYLKNQEYELKHLNSDYSVHIKTLSYEKL